MIIELHNDPSTRSSADSLSKKYGEEVRNHDKLASGNYALNPTTEIPIRRITFLGHADELRNYGIYTSPEGFVGFVDNVIKNNAEHLQELKTIDLFGCRVGQVVADQSFANHVSHGLSDLGYDLEIRAFSHPNSEEYNRTLLQESHGNWRYVGIKTEEDYTTYTHHKDQIEQNQRSLGMEKLLTKKISEFVRQKEKHLGT